MVDERDGDSKINCMVRCGEETNTQAKKIKRKGDMIGGEERKRRGNGARKTINDQFN